MKTHDKPKRAKAGQANESDKVPTCVHLVRLDVGCSACPGRTRKVPAPGLAYAQAWLDQHRGGHAAGFGEVPGERTGLDGADDKEREMREGDRQAYLERVGSLARRLEEEAMRTPYGFARYGGLLKAVLGDREEPSLGTLWAVLATCSADREPMV